MVQRAPLLEEVFQQRAAVAHVNSAADVATCEQFCREQRIDLCVVRIPATRIDLATALQTSQYFLMETSLHFRRSVCGEVASNADSDVSVRLAHADELRFAVSLVRNGFDAYTGHYHCDERLTQEHCTRLYERYLEESWAAENDFVLIAERAAAPVGVITLRKTNSEELEILLATWSRQPLGVGRMICWNVIGWAASEGARFVKTAVSVANIAIQRVAIQNAFTPVLSEYVFHKWFS